MLGGERRDALIQEHGLWHCRQRGTAQDEVKCIVDALTEQNQLAAAAEYYGFESWCTQKVLACTAELREKAEIAAKKARFYERRKFHETRPEALELWIDAEYAKEKLAYLRRTVPPRGKEMCQKLEPVAACQAELETQRAAFEAELNRDDYDAERAARLYETAKQTEATCPETEFQCVVEGLGKYGALPETRKWLQKNLKVLERRQELLARLSPEVRVECLGDIATRHQRKIDDAYAIYVKQSVMFFRNKLERAYLAMHEAQVDCLDHKRHASVSEDPEVASVSSKPTR